MLLKNNYSNPYPSLGANESQNKSSMVRMPFVMILLIITCLFIVISCATRQESTKVLKLDNTKKSVIDAANKVFDALELQDGKLLAELVHPDKGVRFSPSAHINLKVDRVFSREQIESFWTDRNDYLWGYADGTGDPIKQTPAQYLREYILIRGFRKALSVNINDDHASGNTVNNAAAVYPTATRIEYYLKPSIRNSVEQHDWAALRLVFDRVDGSWFLIGVIIDQWSV